MSKNRVKQRLFTPAICVPTTKYSYVAQNLKIKVNK